MIQSKYFIWIFVSLSWLAPLNGFEPGEFYTSGSKEKRAIALTFDDGPGPYTMKFLDLLDKHNVKATFFVLGQQVKRNPKWTQAIHDRDHEFASHLWSHVNYKEVKKHKSLEETKQLLNDDIVKTNQEIKARTKAKPTLLRMPHGIDRPWIKAVAKETGMTLINWTYGADWTKEPYQILEKGYLKAVQPGAILLFHDGGRNRQNSLKLVEAVITKAKEEGFAIQTVSELLKEDNEIH